MTSKLFSPYLFLNYLISIPIQMSSFQKLITQLKSYDQIEAELKKLQQKAKLRSEQLINKYRQNFKVELDKVKAKNNGYYSTDKKKDQLLADERLFRFLEGTWEIQKNHNVTLINQKKVYHQHLANAEQALKAVNNEYDQFIQSKNKQIRLLREHIVRLEAQYKSADNNYQLLLSGQILQAQIGPYAGAKLQDIGLVPYLADKIDEMFEKQLGEVNLGRKELQGMKSKRNSIMGKVEYLVELLKKKQQDKKDMDIENEVQIEYFNKQREELQKETEKCLLKEKEILQLLQQSKREHDKHSSFLIQEMRKCRHYPPQISEFKRIMSRIGAMLQRYRKTEKKRKIEYAKNNTVDKKVERLVDKAKVNQSQKTEDGQLKDGKKIILVGENQQIAIGQQVHEEPSGEEAEIMEIEESRQLSNAGSGKVSSKEQDTVSSVSSRLLPKEDKISLRSQVRKKENEQDKISNK